MDNEEIPEPVKTNEVQELEKEKLRLEIAALKKPWYKRYIVLILPSLLPTCLALVTLFFVYNADVFNLKNERLNINKDKLELEITQFEVQKDAIQKEKQKLILDTVLLSTRLVNITNRLDSAKRNLNLESTCSFKLQKENQEQQSEYERIVSLIKTLPPCYRLNRLRIISNLGNSLTVDELKQKGIYNVADSLLKYLENKKDMAIPFQANDEEQIEYFLIPVNKNVAPVI